VNILHVCDSIVGGTGSYLAELLPLQAARHGSNAITLLVPEQHRGHLETRLTNSDVRFLFFDRPNRVRGMVALARAYPGARRTARPDIVHAHSFGAGFVTRIQPRGRAKLIFCPHGWAFDMDVKPFARRAIVAVEQVLAARVDRIVLISLYEEARAREVGIGGDRLRTVANGISAIPPSVIPADWSDPRLKILFVGRFDRQKGLDVLLAAIEPLGDKLTLRTVGAPVVSDVRPSIPPLSFVEHLGWLSREEVAAQIAACDLLVVPSRWEGFGLVAIEAMRQGKPVMASAVGGLKEILGSGRFGFSVAAGDPIAWRVALVDLTRDEMTRRAEAGRERFRQRYTADRMAAKLDLLYAECLAGQAPMPMPVSPSK